MAPPSVFTAVEDEKIIDLKENSDLTWVQIAQHFPDRSKGSLQVHYSRTLRKKGQRRAAAATVRLQRAINAAAPVAVSSTAPPFPASPAFHTIATGHLGDIEEKSEKQGRSKTSETKKSILRPRPIAASSANITTIVKERNTKTLTEQNGIAGAKLEKPGAAPNQPRGVLPPNYSEATMPETTNWYVIPPLTLEEAIARGTPRVFTCPPKTHVIERNLVLSSHRIRRVRIGEEHPYGHEIDPSQRSNVPNKLPAWPQIAKKPDMLPEAPQLLRKVLQPKLKRPHSISIAAREKAWLDAEYTGGKKAGSKRGRKLGPSLSSDVPSVSAAMTGGVSTAGQRTTRSESQAIKSEEAHSGEKEFHGQTAFDSDEGWDTLDREDAQESDFDEPDSEDVEWR